MKTYLKLLVVLVVAAFALASGQAQAISVTFGGQTPTDGSGLTSIYVGANNVADASNGYYIETFDKPSNTVGGFITVAGPVTTSNIATPIGSGLNSLWPTDLNIVSGGFGIQKGSNSYGAMPAGDSTFYAYAPGAGGTSAEVRVSYVGFLNPGERISYLGMYYGSIDTYNNLAFYNGNNLIQGAAGTLLADGVLTGAEILASQGGSTGNQFLPGSNVYVNIFFDPNETFTSFEFRTTQVAFEVDNIAARIIPAVPEPASMLLLGLGLVGLAGAGRKFKK